MSKLTALVKLHDEIAEGRKQADPKFLEMLCKAVREQIQFCGCEPEEDPYEERQIVGYRWRGCMTFRPEDIEIIYSDS